MYDRFCWQNRGASATEIGDRALILTGYSLVVYRGLKMIYKETSNKLFFEISSKTVISQPIFNFFLIFFLLFQLFTVALLIYSAFAALYYAKYTVADYDYDDYFFKKRSSRSVQQQRSTFLGLPTETYLRIFDAIANINKKYS